MANWYEKLAKAGYLGTKAQVSADYGHPDWSSKQEDGKEPEAAKSPYARALKKASNRSAASDDTGYDTGT